jgi:hypothetical protein
MTSSHTAEGAATVLTLSSTTGVNSDQGFLSTDVGRLVHIKDGHVKITGYTSSTSVSGTVQSVISSGSATDDFAMGSFSDTTGHPRCVTFFEQRLVFAGTTNQPQTLFFSVSGDYENMDDNYHGATTDSSAMIYTIASNQVNAIQAIKATRTLIVMTTGGEFTVTSGGTTAPITPTNLNIRKQSNYGSAGVDGISIGNSTLFLQRAKRKIRELAYNFDTDGYIAPDLTILSENITFSGVVQMDYQQEPFSIVWCVRIDGKLTGMTYNRLQDVVAWHEHDFGGTDAKCKSVAVIDVDTDEDQVWVIVERTINGATKKYVVRFFETVGAKVGPNEDTLDIIPFRDSSAAMTAPVPLFTGDKSTEFPSDYGTDGFVVVKQDQPLPMTILAIYARLELYDT